ncbi:MAG: branched-chain amino acid ABC transporter substrate-binding protein [Frankiales bacterium]|nr:branched-chain amino acid ABC transporter substrate-binding protein [Frankiales bacterium]
MDRKFIVRAALPIALGAVALTACSGSSGSGSTGNNGGGGKKTYTIGFQGPLSGGNAALGINEKDGAQLAIDQANAKGDLPFKLQLKPADDQGSADGSPPAARSLIGDSNVIAVVGPSFSGASDAAGKLYSQANLLMVTPSATLPDLVNHGFTTFYRAVADDFAQGPPDADYLIKKAGAKKVFLIDDTTDYGKGLASAFKGELSKAGGKLAGSDSAPQTSTCIPGATGSTSQYPSEASKVKSSGADSVFYAGYYCDFALLAKALRNAGFKGQLMSGDGSDDSKYVQGAGAANANGTLLSCQCSDIASNPNGASFISAYKSAFHVDPGAYSAESFDVTNAVISVLKGLGSNPTRQAVVSAFASVNYQGLTKAITFGSDHNLKVQTAFLYKVVNGKITYVGDLSKLV